jgi:glycosyltransferase involved in cell wall biosynthesis
MQEKRNPPKLLIVFNTVSLYGMERSVIETMDLLRPDIAPHFLLSYTTYRLNLPLLSEIKRRKLSYSFYSDKKGWPTLGRPKSLRHLVLMILTTLKGNYDVLRASRNHDVIYLPGIRYFYFATLAVLFNRFSGKNVVYHFHDLVRRPSLPLKLATPLISDFIHNTHLGYRITASIIPSILKKRNHIVPYPISHPHPTEDNTPFASPDMNRNILFVGQVSPHKGVDILIEAFNSIAGLRKDITLQIVGGLGDVEFEKIFFQSIETGDLKDKIKYWGYRDDVHEILRTAYVYVHPSPPSLTQESFGRGVVEAMSAGVPAVCFRSGALQEIVVHEETGLICEDESPACLAQNLLRFLDDVGFRNRCGKRALEQYEACYSAPQVRERWLPIFIDKSG